MERYKPKTFWGAALLNDFERTIARLEEQELQHKREKEAWNKMYEKTVDDRVELLLKIEDLEKEKIDQ